MTFIPHAGFRVVAEGQCFDWPGLREEDLDFSGLRSKSEMAILASASAIDVARAIALIDGHVKEIHLVPNGMPDIDLQAKQSSMTHRGSDTRWIIYTSGTTGTPRRAIHTLTTLTRTTSARTDLRELVWGLLYEPTRMAGLQVILQAMASGSILAVPDAAWGISRKIEWMRTHKVTALSATPTLWRQILSSPSADGWPLEQVTLGGEIADQRTLDALSATFPTAHITHVFASTEAGAAFAVNDRISGFPLSYLESPPKDVRLRVIDGELEVFAPKVQSSASCGGWVRTGDAVAVQGERVIFLGRKSGIINVGGVKVWPEQVEVILREHPDVTDAQVAARPNPFTGSILVASVTVQADADAGIAAALREWVRDRAPGAYVPATVKVVDRLGTSQSGKVVRK